MKLRLNSKPVTVAIEAENKWFRNYKSGIISKGCGQAVDHSVTAVGYGTSGGKDYFLVKNSWGTSWGEKGYVRIASDQCGINLYAQSVNMSYN